ncbi:MAG: glycosyltransferase family 4 protein [Acidimicrobiales bacterium]
MRVGLVVQQLRRAVPGGIGTYAVGLVGGLAAMGAGAPEVTLLASRPPSRLASRPPGRSDPLADLGLPLVTSRLPPSLLTRAWDAGWRAPGLGRSLGDGVDFSQPMTQRTAGRPPSTGASSLNLVHSVSLGGPATGGVPSVACVHDLAWRSLPEAFPDRGRRWHEAALARGLLRTDRFVVPSEATADALLGAGAKPGTVVVVEEGCDHLAPVDQPATDAQLGLLGVDGPYLLCVGTLEPRKNLARLLGAYAAVRAELPEPWPLVVVGPKGWGPQAGPFGTGPFGTGPAGVVLAGVVSPGVLSGLYAGARCVAYVPLLEGWGLPAVEAMSMGVPVVASPMPSTAGQALEVDPTDVDSIADGLGRAAGDEDERVELIARGLARTAGLSWEATARAHVAVWAELA